MHFSANSSQRSWVDQTWNHKVLELAYCSSIHVKILFQNWPVLWKWQRCWGCQSDIRKAFSSGDVDASSAVSASTCWSIFWLSTEKMLRRKSCLTNKTFCRKSSATLKPGQYYLGIDGVLRDLRPGQRAPSGTQVVSIKSNETRDKTAKPVSIFSAIFLGF